MDESIFTRLEALARSLPCCSAKVPRDIGTSCTTATCDKAALEAIVDDLRVFDRRYRNLRGAVVSMVTS